jgi:uncharacterized protein (DUF58 family)
MNNTLDKDKIEIYKSLDIFARQVVEGFITGLHKSPFHGFSVEFAEHRLYNNGESTKNIDWKLYGRTDKLFVKRYEEETNLRCQLVIDTSSSMYFPVDHNPSLEHPNKMTFAVYAAAVLMELLKKQRDAFGLTLFSNKIDIQTDTRSSTLHQKYIYTLLEPLLQKYDAVKNSMKKTSIADPLHLVAEKLKRRSLVVILTDGWVDTEEQEKVFDALRHLRHCKHEVMLFHIYDNDKEINLNYGNKPHHFIDVETNKQIKIHPNEIAEQYRNLMAQQTATLKERAIQYGVDYIPADINQGFHQVLQPYLIKRSRLY